MSTVLDWIGAALLILGVLFMLLAAVGIVRMPDVFMRLQASSKASTLGIGAVLLALAVHFADLATSLRAAALIAFTFLTVPVAAQALGLAAHRMRVPMWPRTQKDELAEHEGQAVGSRDAGSHLQQR